VSDVADTALKNARQQELAEAGAMVRSFLDGLEQRDRVSVLRYLAGSCAPGQTLAVRLMAETRELRVPGEANESFRVLAGLQDDGSVKQCTGRGPRR